MENKTKVSDIESVTGAWTGTVKQLLNGKDVEYGVKLELQNDGDNITGNSLIGLSEMNLKDASGKIIESVSLLVNGSFYETRFLSLSYKNPKEKLHFGYMVIDLYDNTVKAAPAIKGLFIGYGPQSKKVINGEIILTKVS